MAYRDFILSRGYKIEREDISAAGDARLLILFSKVQAPVAIDDETALLEAKASGLGGEHDGWETQIIRERQ